MNEPVHTNTNKLPADRTAVSVDTSHERKESEMTELELLREALFYIADFNHESDETPQWFKQMELDDSDEERKKTLLAKDEIDWHDLWRDEHGWEDSQYLEAVIEKARETIRQIYKGTVTYKVEVNDGFSYSIHDTETEILVGKARWIGPYFICWHTDGVANDNYLIFEEEEDAKAYLQWIADHSAMQVAKYKHASHADTFKLPEPPKAKNTGDELDPWVDFVSQGVADSVYDKRNRKALILLGVLPEEMLVLED